MKKVFLSSLILVLLVITLIGVVSPGIVLANTDPPAGVEAYTELWGGRYKNQNQVGSIYI